MTKIALDGKTWVSTEHFYDALLAGLGAPEWHGRNLDALEETLRTGDINALNPPLEIEVSGIESMGAEARRTLDRFQDLVTDLQAAAIQVQLTVR